MNDQTDPLSSRMRKRQLKWLEYPAAPRAVFMTSLLVTAALCYFSEREVDSRARDRFTFRVAQVGDAVKNRMLDYEQVLRGGVGLFLVSPSVSRKQWHDYVTNAEMPTHFPGIQNMAIDVPVAAAQLEKHIAGVRAEGFAQYTIRPEQPERAVYHALVYVEPFSDRNLRAFGFDMYTNPVRRVAMDRAIDLGLPSISGMVKLAQETNQDVQHGFIFCLPVYLPGLPLADAGQRRQALRALVCGGFRMNDLMRGIFGPSASDMELEIFDNGVIEPESRMYASFAADGRASDPFVSVVPIEVGGRPWSLRVSANQKFIDSVTSSQTLMVAVAGILLNLALFAVLSSLSGREQKARKLADEMTRELFSSESRFSDIVSSASDAIVSMDMGGTITSWNPAAERMFGYSAAEAIGKTGLLSGPSEQCAYDDFRKHRMALGGQMESTDVVRVRKDGSLLNVSVAVSQMCNADGKVYGVSELITDVTRRKLDEAELRIAAVAFDSQEAMLVTDTKNVILRVNRAFTRITGYEAAEAIGRTPRRIQSGRHDAEFYRAMWGGISRTGGWQGEIWNRRKNGEVYPAWLTISEVRNGDGIVTNYIGAHHDISEHKQAERLKSEFVSTVSHELRTPLTSIRGALGLIIGKFSGALPDNVRQLLDTANRNSERLTLLINDILDMEKVAAGKLQFVMAVQPLMPLVAQALSANQSYAEQHQVQFVLVEAAEQVEVWVDADRLMQVLSNYLSNAAKFSPPRGRVEIAVCRLGEQVRVSVRDSGPGIAAAFRTRIFEKFSQADSSDTRKKGGTGLGLAITRALVEQMGGNVGFDSAEGEGATFYFDLPIHKPQPQHGEESA